MPKPFETQVVAGVTRYRYNVGAIRIPHADRHAARKVMPDEAAVTDRGYRSVFGADEPDDDPRFPVGDPQRLDGPPAVYTLMLTEAEAEALRAAPEHRYVVIDPEVRHS